MIPISPTVILDIDQANETRDLRDLVADAQKVSRLLELAVLGTMHDATTASQCNDEDHQLLQELAWGVGTYLHAIGKALEACEQPAPSPGTAAPKAGTLRAVRAADEARS